MAERVGIRVFQFSEEALDWGYEHDGTSAKPARRPGFGAGPPGIAGRRHPLPAILTLAVCAMLSGARSLYAIHQWGRQQDAATVQAMGFTRPRTPAVGSLHTVFRRLDAAAFETALAWVEPGGTAGRERHCGGRQSPAGDSRPRVARGAPGGRICSRIQPGGRAKGGWGRYRGN